MQPVDAPTTRLVLIPALGTDARLYAHQAEVFPELHVAEFIEPEPGEPMALYAERFAQTIPQDRPLLLGGASFGGILATEVSAFLPARGLALIATARTARAMTPLYRIIAALTEFTPECRLNLFALGISKALSRFDVIDPDSQATYEDMLARASPRFLRWAVHAVRTWEMDARPHCPACYLHGSADQVFRTDDIDDLDVIDGAGHLLTITHPEQVNDFLRYCLVRAESDDPWGSPPANTSLRLDPGNPRFVDPDAHAA